MLKFSELFYFFAFCSKRLQKFFIFEFFSAIFAQMLMKCYRNFADILENVEIFWIFYRKFLNFERLLTELRSEWFVWFGPSPTEPFNSGRRGRRPGRRRSRRRRASRACRAAVLLLAWLDRVRCFLSVDWRHCFFKKTEAENICGRLALNRAGFITLRSVFFFSGWGQPFARPSFSFACSFSHRFAHRCRSNNVVLRTFMLRKEHYFYFLSLVKFSWRFSTKFR